MTDNNQQTNPRVFISYSWDSPEHKLWVESFARELRKEGIDARIDAWRDESQSIDDFMMLELERAEYVLAICTPQYKQKIIENAEGDVHTASGFEMGSAAALRRAGGKDIIPVLRAGTWTEAAPTSLISYRFYDFTGSEIGSEFEQLRERLLGHVHRPPELGQPKGPVAAPDLPDIFEGQDSPAPRTKPGQVLPDASRSAPNAARSMPAAAAPAARKGGKNWLWAVGGAVGVIVLLLLIPTDDDGDVDSEQSTAQLEPRDGGASDQTGLADMGTQDDGVTEDWAAGIESPDESADLTHNAPLEQPEIQIAGGWASVTVDSGCMQITQLTANTWLTMGYDASVDLYFLQVYDPKWDELPVGQSDRVVTDFDESPDSAQFWSVEGIQDQSDGSRGIHIQFVDDTFLGSLGSHDLLSFYWDEGDEGGPWVMDANLRGSGGAYSNLAACAAGFGK